MTFGIQFIIFSASILEFGIDTRDDNHQNRIAGIRAIHFANCPGHVRVAAVGNTKVQIDLPFIWTMSRVIRGPVLLEGHGISLRGDKAVFLLLLEF